MTDLARDSMSKRFASMRETSKPSLEWALDLTKLAVPGAIILGSFFVFAYLQSMGAPLPTADLPAMTSLFLSILILYGAFAIVGAIVVLLPAVACSTPEILRQRINAGAPPPGARAGILRAALERTLILDSGFYFGLIGLLVGSAASAHRATRISTGTTVLCIGLSVLSGTGFGLWRQRRSRTKHMAVSDARENACPDVPWHEIGFYSIRNGLFGLIWSMLILLLALRLLGLDREPMSVRTDVSWVGLILLVAALYAVLTAVPKRVERFGTLVTPLVLMPAIVSSSSVGAGTLRLLGAGGGLPVSLLLAPAPGIANQPASPECGCLILNAGSQVVLLPKSLAGPAPCADTQAPFLMKERRAPTMFSKVELLPAARILRIGPPKSDGHDLR